MSSNKKTIIGIDSALIPKITDYIGQDDRHKNKFIDIVRIILEGLSNRHLFKHEKINNDINNVWAMRFFVGQENDRIYCQELSYNDKKIFILSELHLHKTSDQISEIESNIIKLISKYEYEIEDNQRKQLND